MPPTAAALLAALQRDRVLLVQDASYPSIASMVAGEIVRGSWWSHPAAKLIYARLNELEDHPDVVIAKLVSGKNTLIHRRLWVALVAVGRARDPWQLDGLSPAASALLDALERRPQRDSTPAAKELDLRLLARVRQVHTERGAHALELSSWSDFARAERVPTITSTAGALSFEQCLGSAADRLPWRAKPRAKASTKVGAKAGPRKPRSPRARP